MTVREMIALIRERLPDEWAQRVSDLRIIYAINRAYKRFAWEAYAFEANVSFNVPAQVGIFVLPEWVGVIRAATWKTEDGSIFPLSPISRYLIETSVPDWQVKFGTGTPTHYFVYSDKEIVLIPCPDKGGCLEARCVLIPSKDPQSPLRELNSPDSEPAFRELFHEALVDGALADLFLVPSEGPTYELHLFYEQRFKQWVKRYQSYVDTLDDRSLEVHSFLTTQPLVYDVQLPMPTMR